MTDERNTVISFCPTCHQKTNVCVIWCKRLTDYLKEKLSALEKENKPYNLDLSRYKAHKRVFPWMFVIKVIIGLAMTWVIYYMARELFSAKESQPAQQETGIGVEISTD